jgi:hypothetical protein
MRRIILALALMALVSLTGVVSAEYVRPKMAVEPTAQRASGAEEDFLLLHDGDHVRVRFREKAGPGSIRFLSLSDSSRLDIVNPLAGAEKNVFRKEQGWQTYPHEVGGQVVTVILRETGAAAIPEWDLPGCSDVVVRIDNAAIFAPDGAEVGAPIGARCPVCGAVLDW